MAKKKRAETKRRYKEWRPKIFADFATGKCAKCSCGSKFLADQSEIVTREFGPFAYANADALNWTFKDLLHKEHCVSIRVEWVEVEEGTVP